MAVTLPPNPSVAQRHAMGLKFISFLVLVTLFTSFRVWDMSRRRKIGLHDLFAIIAYFAAGALYSVEIYMYTRGFDAPPGHITPGWSNASARVWFAYSITFITTVSFALASFTILYWKLFATPVCRRVIIVLSTLQAVNAVGRYLVAVFQCTPVKKTFQPNTPGKCLDRVPTFAAANAVDFVLTAALFIIPVVKLWHANLARGKKAGIIFMLACGLTIAVMDIVAVYTILEERYGSKKFSPLLNSVMTNIHVMIGILCVNMPSIYHVVQHHFPRMYRCLQLGSSEDDIDGDKVAPSPIDPVKPETIGQRRVNRNVRYASRSLPTNVGRFSNWLQRSRLSSVRELGTRTGRPETPQSQAQVLHGPSPTHSPSHGQFSPSMQTLDSTSPV